jgi:anti-sigma B factor antagonist
VSSPALAEQLPRPGRVPLVEIVVTEAIDARVAPPLRALLDEALALRPELLVVDLAACPMIDASGIDALLKTHRQAIRDGGRLSLRAPSLSVHRNLQLDRAAHALHIVWPPATLTAEEWSAAAGTGAFVASQLAP